MAGKRSPTNRHEEPRRINDLKLINGIGPAVEKRLNGVGVRTFAQLAALSPADLAAAVADLTGLSSERIIKQDWIGQAQKLAAEVVASEAQENVRTTVKPSTPMELLEPQQADKLTAEVFPSEAQEDIEAPTVAEQVFSSTDPVELPTSQEHSPITTLSEEPEKHEVSSMERFHPASFTVEFLLDDGNNIHSTHVLHLQSKRKGIWAGWQKTQLIAFLRQSARLNIPSDEPALLNTKEPDLMSAVVTESEPLTRLAAKPRLTGTLRLREMEMIGVESGSTRKTLTHDEPFEVCLTLDLTELQVPGNTPLSYKASIYGKDLNGRSDLVLGERWGSRSGVVLGKAQGTILPTDIVTIKVAENRLPKKGIYRLAATVVLGLPGMKPRVRPGTTAVVDGGQVQVL